ncbi:hypothetical protein F2Q70_00019370 [Brassica cretica]|uniref:Transmembrane protein n=1 Tax=Brassica cretica TaxID=69181 RepID=A0A8S9GTD2_BRACR|nr:hypothetical protein F2Q70_00019370 [Brassica cretica]KAF3611983.1 hypothetical protein DY000_02044370 [Brassica cretica]
MDHHHHHNHNHNHNQWRKRLSFKNATIALTLVNLLIFLFLLQGFFSSSSRRPVSAQLRYVKEAEEIRLKMQPLELIKRVREIEHESSAGQETEQEKDVKQNAAVDLSKRLKDFRSLNDASSLKALEEWRKRKMERARQRDLEKTGGLSSSKTS